MLLCHIHSSLSSHYVSACICTYGWVGSFACTFHKRMPTVREYLTPISGYTTTTRIETPRFEPKKEKKEEKKKKQSCDSVATLSWLDLFSKFRSEMYRREKKRKRQPYKKKEKKRQWMDIIEHYMTRRVFFLFSYFISFFLWSVQIWRVRSCHDDTALCNSNFFAFMRGTVSLHPSICLSI